MMAPGKASSRACHMTWRNVCHSIANALAKSRTGKNRLSRNSGLMLCGTVAANDCAHKSLNGGVPPKP